MAAELTAIALGLSGPTTAAEAAGAAISIEAARTAAATAESSIASILRGTAAAAVSASPSISAAGFESTQANVIFPGAATATWASVRAIIAALATVQIATTAAYPGKTVPPPLPSLFPPFPFDPPPPPPAPLGLVPQSQNVA